MKNAPTEVRDAFNGKHELVISPLLPPGILASVVIYLTQKHNHFALVIGEPLYSLVNSLLVWHFSTTSKRLKISLLLALATAFSLQSSAVIHCTRSPQPASKPQQKCYNKIDYDLEVR